MRDFARCALAVLVLAVAAACSDTIVAPDHEVRVTYPDSLAVCPYKPGTILVPDTAWFPFPYPDSVPFTVKVRVEVPDTAWIPVEVPDTTWVPFPYPDSIPIPTPYPVYVPDTIWTGPRCLWIIPPKGASDPSGRPRPEPTPELWCDGVKVWPT